VVSILAFHAGYQGSSPCIGTRYLFVIVDEIFIFMFGDGENQISKY
jgi:hypothetical protein